MTRQAVADEDPLTREVIGAAIEVHRFFDGTKRVSL